ncbi:hypothetical protein [Nitratireductor aquibiodomus]|nr:hypothetical protein [Nitratireductor aquibiodomus]
MPHFGATRVLTSALTLTGLALVVYLLTYDGAPVVWLSVLAAMGFGLGASMTAASSVIMLSTPEKHAGMAASVEEVSFELGGALGIAVLGSVMTALYTRAMTVPAGVDATVADSFDEALLASESLGDAAATQLRALARGAFDEAFIGVIALASLFVLGVAFGIWRKAVAPH